MTIASLDAAFVFLVTAAAMVYPPLALAVGAAFLIVTVVVNDRRTVADEQA